jgi:hypothetical protein
MDLLPGFCAGVARVTVSYPVDYVRTLQQASNLHLRAAWAAVGNPTQLYRGAGLAFVAVPCERAVQFAAFEAANRHGFGPLGCALAGAGGALAVSTWVQPLLTQRIVHGVSLRDAVARIATKPKVLTLAAGTELLRTSLASTAYLYAYGHLRAALPEYAATKTLAPATQGAVAGVGASLLALCLVYPLETQRIRLHAGAGTLHGWHGLYRGVGLAAARTVPSAAVGMWVYETVRRAMVPQ